jgi:autotransporter adhesin
VILPDVNFTLSGNVGFYEGAQAIAINASARVAPNTYVTGAFGGGLNKRGAVGGRVGVVFGF